MTRPVPEELISAYFDGEVTPEERNEIERLLDSSSELRQQLDDTSKLSALLHSFPREAAPEEIMTRVQQRVTRTVLAPQAIPVGVRASACPESTEVRAAAGSSVSSPSTISTRRSLRREWIAFGAGTMATMASLLLCVTWNRSQTASERVGIPTVTEFSVKQVPLFSAEQIPSEQKMALNEQEHLIGVAPARKAMVRAMSLGDAVSEGLAPAKDADRQLPKIAMSVASPDADADTNGNLAATVSSQHLYYEQGDYQPPTPNELMESLKDGKVIRKNYLDPSNNVVVVEFTVVDVDSFMNEMQFLLRKRSVPQAEDGATLGIAGRNESREGVAEKGSNNVGQLKKTAPSDGLVAIYVRATGPQLSDTIAESINTNPKNYRGFVPQLPIDLRKDVTANSLDSADQQSIAAIESQVSSGVWGEQPIAVEAKLAVNNYAGDNGLAFDTVAKTVDDQKQTSSALNSGSSAKSDKALAESAPSDAKRRLPSRQPSSEELKRDDLASSKSEAGTGLPGYATFHLALNDQRQSGQQKASALAQNSRVASIQFAPSNNQMVPNSPLPGNGPSSIFNGGLGQKQAVRTNVDNRMVRMLIVLKPEQSTAKRAP